MKKDFDLLMKVAVKKMLWWMLKSSNQIRLDLLDEYKEALKKKRRNK